MKAAELSEKLTENIGKVIAGKDEAVKKIVTALICGGHILLEDIPGTGKTTLAKALAASCGCSFSRIQFTPDLLPSDLTGMNCYNQKTGDFYFRRGSVFAGIVLADEINRATPRTQSGLLECMEEKSVTVEGQTYKLDEPFTVIATQNPVETQGTFPLPEAQLDRFLIRLSLGYPERDFEKEMLMGRTSERIGELLPVASAAEILAAREEVNAVKVSEPVTDYILNLAAASRESGKISLGVSPRGCLALLRAARGCAAINGRDYVLPDDVKEMSPSVLSHRIIPKSGGIYSRRANGEELIKEIINSAIVPTE